MTFFWDLNESHLSLTYTGRKMKFSIKDFFSKFDQIPSFLRIWSHLLKKSLMENFIFCAVLSSFSNVFICNDDWVVFVFFL